MKLGLFFAASIKTVASQAGTDYSTDFDDLENFDDEELGSGFLRNSMINKRLANPFFNLIQDSNEDGNIMERASFRELLEERLFASSKTRPKKNRRERKEKRKRKEKREPVIINEYGIATNYVESPSEKMTGMGIIKEDGSKELKCLNQEGSCRRNHCECDKKLAEDLALHEMTLNPLNRREFGFEPEMACKKADSRSTSTSSATEQSCCGVYPNRFPFVSNRNQGESLRKCCLNKTYDPRKLACCPGHEVKTHGTCSV
ncbi:unnamed protein product [Oikopleura dioica]|uniref:Phospholipase A2 domain-containing protein n=1 Tax=Oikopleura dioica TaxID=34765 RepID=E4YF04_OIKDI|nr:unnamed protein product [Oikopleura dioica]